ncbi:MAG: methionyl-tRNA formyltransferase [Planctomycetes bacterium]|nr:methionyl-tRNA formyltransferase [Planctomycetota bacterium]
MRLVFFGSGEFGIPTLEALAAAGHDIALVTTQPNRPAGRGGKTRQTPVRAAAETMGFPVRCPEKPNTDEFVREIGALAPDLAVVVAYGHLLRQGLLHAPRLGCVNLHASLLPAYRGAAPVPWAIYHGEKVSGVTVFRLDEKFDTGGILGTASLPIEADDTSESYLHKLAPIGAQLMADTVAALAAGTAVPQPQDDSLSSPAPKLKKEDGALDWSRPFASLERQVRAFQPWPLAHTEIAARKGMLKLAVLRMIRSDIQSDAMPGTVVAADQKNGLVIMTADGPARLESIRPEGKRTMKDVDFLRGAKVMV